MQSYITQEVYGSSAWDWPQHIMYGLYGGPWFSCLNVYRNLSSFCRRGIVDSILSAMKQGNMGYLYPSSLNSEHNKSLNSNNDCVSRHQSVWTLRGGGAQGEQWQGLPVLPLLSWNSTCRLAWPWTLRVPPASASPELEVKAWTTTPSMDFEAVKSCRVDLGRCGLSPKILSLNSLLSNCCSGLGIS